MKRRGVLTATTAAVRAGVASAATSPKGTYTTSIKGVAAAIDGKWQVVLTASGPFTITRNGALAIKGRTSVVGSKITFRDSSGHYACPPAQAGVYRWKLAGRSLTLTAIAERCQGRLLVLTRHPLTKIT
jgi:hypothetical protein